MLASNADRDRTVDVLRAAYAEGRLTKEEYDLRAGRALASRTVEELQRLTVDVPHGPGNGPAPPPSVYQGYPPAYRGYGRPGVYPPPVVPYAPPTPNNGAAVGALVCGLLAPVTLGFAGVPAVILGHKARAEIRRSGERGDGMAVAGLALGWIGVCFALLFFLGVFVD
jgi:hypothetical protein